MNAEALSPEASEATSPRLPVVAIVGPPNAGKSTLFNRLVHTQRAIVDSRPGVTRDRNIATADWGGRKFLLVDTGGFEEKEGSSLAAAVRTQSLRAAEEADAVIVLLDGRAGLSPLDRDLVERLRPLRTPVFYAINKLDTPGHDDQAADFFALGLPLVFPISVAHGRGITDLMDHVLEQLQEPAAAAAPAARGAVNLAIVGRPNVGKSSLLNCILGFERAIVDATPGTTRDAIDTAFCAGDQPYILVDTAGIRRRPRVYEQVERASAARALRALDRAEVAVVVIDAVEGMTEQDARIAGYAWERGRGLLFVVNKWDAVPRAERKGARVLALLRDQYPTLGEVPVVFLSALTGAGVNDLFPALKKLVAAHRREMRTVRLNELLGEVTRAQAPPSVHGKRPRFFYAAQTGIAPPTITIFTSAPELVPPTYERYLINAFRSAFDLQGTPVRLHLRRRPRAKDQGPKSKPRA
ncbi:MAG TPA: ribosome biogenesis GTPase Der [Candidatus Binatia bacterium]